MQQEMEYIYEVYREKNFTRAAENLYITQPALSMAIQKAEERIGIPIFDRSTRPISLTDAGEAYIDYIESTRHLDAEFDRQIRDELKALWVRFTVDDHGMWSRADEDNKKPGGAAAQRRLRSDS